MDAVSAAWPRPVDDLLDGEDPETAHPQDARHWIAMYREMIAFNLDLVERARQVLARTSPRTGAAPRLAADIVTLEEQRRRYERRLEFWYAQQWKLEGLHLDREARTVEFRERKAIKGQQLLVEAWHDSRLPEETLRTYIVRLRGKLSALQAGLEIVNIPRRGYVLSFSSTDGLPSPAPRNRAG